MPVRLWILSIAYYKYKFVSPHSLKSTNKEQNIMLKIREKFMNNELHPQIKWFLCKKWKDVNKPRLCPLRKSPQENDSFSCSLKKHQQQEKNGCHPKVCTCAGCIQISANLERTSSAVPKLEQSVPQIKKLVIMLFSKRLRVANWPTSSGPNPAWARKLIWSPNHSPKKPKVKLGLKNLAMLRS